MLVFPLVALLVCLLGVVFPVWLLIRVRRVAPLMADVAALEVRVDHLTDSLALLRRDVQALSAAPPTPRVAPQADVAAVVDVERVASSPAPAPARPLPPATAPGAPVVRTPAPMVAPRVSPVLTQPNRPRSSAQSAPEPMPTNSATLKPSSTISASVKCCLRMS